jgi:hypothetical protein
MPRKAIPLKGWHLSDHATSPDAARKVAFPKVYVNSYKGNVYRIAPGQLIGEAAKWLVDVHDGMAWSPVRPRTLHDTPEAAAEWFEGTVGHAAAVTREGGE